MRRLRLLGPLALILAAVPAAGFERAPTPSEGVLEACPSQGEGFGRIPGTSTCIRVSGRVAAGADLGAGRPAPATYGRFSLETRGETDAGPLRSFVRVDGGRR